MNYLFQKWKQIGGHGLCFWVKCVENLSDFENYARLNQHGLQGL